MYEGEQGRREVGDEGAGGGRWGFLKKELRGEGRRGGRGRKIGEKGKEGKRGNFERSKRGGRRQGGGNGGGCWTSMKLTPCPPPHVCWSVFRWMSFYVHANTLECRKMFNPELILYFEAIPIDLSPRSVSSSRVCLKLKSLVNDSLKECALPLSSFFIMCNPTRKIIWPRWWDDDLWFNFYRIIGYKYM